MGRKRKYNSPEEYEAVQRYDSIKDREKRKGIVLEDNWSKNDFIAWYLKTEKRCVYCTLTQDEIRCFHELVKRRNKRGTTRGRSLEIDRKTDGSYTEENCVFSCYYCNNAKSDIFEAEEFKVIGQAIAMVIRSRIATKSECNDEDIRY